jgi:Ca-activated chloride channel homolog
MSSSRWNEREVARRLSRRDEQEPPADLLERIRSEIPPAVSVAPEAAPTERRRAMDGTRKGWLAAASLAAMVGAGVIGMEVYQKSDPPGVAPDEGRQKAASAPLGEEPARVVAGLTRSPEAVEPGGGNAAGPAREAKKESMERVEAPAAPAKPQVRQNALQDARAVPEELESLGSLESRDQPVAPPPPPPGPAAGARSRQSLVKAENAPLSIARPDAAFGPSTGGTAEPNDQPYGDVFFRSHGVNPFVDTEDDRLSTFGLDVDTGSYTVARRYLSDGHLPPPESVRVEEYVNYFDYRDAPPARGDFALRAEGAPSPFAGGDRYRLLRFSIRGREVRAEDRKPAVLTFVVDVSGSMDLENRLGLVKQALGLLIGQLRPDDRVGLVVYGDRGRVLIEPTGDREAVLRAIARLAPSGSTNAEEGLALGYEVARRHFREGGVNRVVLCSDGVANVGATGPDSILERIGREADRGIELTTVGFGMGNYNDVLMERLADRGDGRYAYVDTLEEARRIFVEELTGTLQTIARDAKAQLEFDPAVVARWRLLGYENRDIADERFRDDTVDAGEIGAGHSVTALYEVKLHPGEPGGRPLALLRLRYRSPETGRVHELEQPLRASELARSWEAASPALRLASVVAELAEILKGSFWAKEGRLDEVFRRAQRVSADFAGDAEVAEFVSLAGKAARLWPAERP